MGENDLDVSDGGRPLSFEEFEKRRNNFALHFAGKPGEHMMGDMYRDRKAYQEAAKDPEFQKLVGELTDYDFMEYTIDKDGRTAIPRQVDPNMKQKLYQAYLIMRRYAQNEWKELFA